MQASASQQGQLLMLMYLRMPQLIKYIAHAYCVSMQAVVYNFPDST